MIPSIEIEQVIRRAIADTDWSEGEYFCQIARLELPEAEFTEVVEVAKIIAAEDMGDRISETLDALRDSPVAVYRELHLPVGQTVAQVKLAGVGIFWSYDEEAAEAHWSPGGSGPKIKLKAVIDHADIDWFETLVIGAQQACGDEKEVRLLAGRPLTIEAISCAGGAWQPVNLQATS